jgi:hypothetical protein
MEVPMFANQDADGHAQAAQHHAVEHSQSEKVNHSAIPLENPEVNVG